MIQTKKKLNYPKNPIERNESKPEGQGQSQGQNLHKCLICKEKFVPELIVATVDPPDGLQIIGKP